MHKQATLQTGGQILLIPTGAIRENPLRARLYYNDGKTDELIRSIELSGIVEPLTVCAVDRGLYVIISGERRFRAAKALGYKAVPCVLIESESAAEALFTCLSNQLTHDPLSFFEVALCYEKLRDAFSLTYEQTAARLGVSPAEVLGKVRLLQIPPRQRRQILENGLSESYARLLLRHPDAQKAALLDQIIAERLSLRQAKERSNRLLRGAAPKRSAPRGYYKDARVFINTIDRACRAMRDGGVPAAVEREESTESVSYRITVPKETA